MSCPEIGSFAREIAEHKAIGATLEEQVRRLHHSLGPEHSDAEQALEGIIRAIYTIRIFSTATPDEVGNAYQVAYEMGAP
jgi:hypothetical protein